MSNESNERLTKSDKKFVLGLFIILTLFPITLAIPLKIRSEIRIAESKVLAFYYTWYGNTTIYDGEKPGSNGDWIHWVENNHNPPITLAANHTPILGAFDSADNDTIEQHISWAEYCNIDGLIATWWGQNDLTDYNFRKLLNVASRISSNMLFTVYFETLQPQYLLDWNEVVNDLEYLIDNYGEHPYFLKYENRPVIFIYSIKYVSSANWTKIMDKLHTDGYNPYLIVDIQDPKNADEQWLTMFDGYHIYNPAGMYRDNLNVKQLYSEMIFYTRIAKKLSMITVIPGYNDFAVCNPFSQRNTWFDVPRRDGDLYKEMWDMAKIINPDWILITSFNEWHEGSEIEPSIEFGLKYIEDTKNYATNFKS